MSAHSIVLIRRLLGRPGAVHQDESLGACELAALRAARHFAGPEGTVTAVALGRSRREEKALELAMRFAADRAIRITDSGADRLNFLGTAQVLGTVIREAEPYDAIFCGDRSQDEGSGAVGPAVAELLGLPHLCAILDLERDGEKHVTVVTQGDGARHRFRVELPSVLCVRRWSREPPEHSGGEAKAAVRNYRDLGINPRDLRAYGRPRIAVNPVRKGNNATILNTADELLARLARDQLL